MRRALLVFVAATLFWVATAPRLPAYAAEQHNWTSYLGGARHPSFTTNTQIGRTAAGQLKLAWSWKPAGPTMTGQPTNGMFASPAVYNHRIYLGAYTGVFYALDETTGSIVWKRFLGFQPSLTCVQPLGFVSTATVAAVPNSTGTGTTPVVYVAAPDGYLYALDGISGAVRWRSLVVQPSSTVNDAFNWSSPTLLGGRIYVGFASNCDHPWIRGGLMVFDQNTGVRLATWYAVPAGSIGGGLWTSAAATSDAVFVTTGSTCSSGSPPETGCTSTNQEGDSYSLVRLDPTNLARRSAFKVPATELRLAGDPDWGSSPVIFNATINGTVTRLVGACHKNGYFYALRTANLSTPQWKRHVGTATDDGGDACLAAAIYDGSRLFLAGNATTIGGVSYQGSIRRVDPATGNTIWARGLSANVLGTPAENGAGVIAAATHDFIPSGLLNQTYLLDAATGAVLKTIANGKEFAQPIFADKYLLLTSAYTNTLYAYTP
jgi:outer membrane protein assembly factor BamB